MNSVLNALNVPSTCIEMESGGLNRPLQNKKKNLFLMRSRGATTVPAEMCSASCPSSKQQGSSLDPSVLRHSPQQFCGLGKIY